MCRILHINPAFNLRIAKQWAPVNILFYGMIFTSMASLQYNNSVPMIRVFKSFATIMTATGDCIIYGASIDLLVIVALSLMLAGAVMAALHQGAVMAARNDAEITHVCFFWMLAHCVFTSGYVLYLKYATKSLRLSKFDMVFYNNTLNSLFLFPISVMNGEFKTFMSTPALHSMEYVMIGFAGLVGFFQNLASLNCIIQISPTTYALIGSLNYVAVAFIGERQIETGEFIYLSLMGGILYIVAKTFTLLDPFGMNDLLA